MILLKKLNKFLIALICNMKLFLLTFSNAVVPHEYYHSPSYNILLLFLTLMFLIAICIFIIKSIIEIKNKKGGIRVLLFNFLEFFIVYLAISGMIYILCSLIQ